MPSTTYDHPAQAAVNMDYDDHGSGSEPIVFVHGYGCGRSDWQQQVSAFSRDFRVLTVDLPGHCTSTRQIIDCRVENLGDHVAHLLTSLDFRNVTLVGHSMGCRVVMKAAFAAPTRIANVVLVDGSWIGTGDAKALETQAKTVFHEKGFVPTIRHLFNEMFLDDRHRELRERMVARAEGLDPNLGTNLFGSLVAWDAEHSATTLSALACRVLVIQSTYLNAERQRVALRPGESTPWLDLVRTRRPDAMVETISEVGHFTMIESAERVNTLIRSFIANKDTRLHNT